ncbi:DUF7079 family protein [Reyranella soli]|uniref:DUF7079 family protein n=1 Tax=Reyranella soli TaxID=1230389 RepID=UPI00403A862E
MSQMGLCDRRLGYGGSGVRLRRSAKRSWMSYCCGMLSQSDIDRRSPVWHGLSQLFLDTELQCQDYESIAGRLRASAVPEHHPPTKLTTATGTFGCAPLQARARMPPRE